MKTVKELPEADKYYTVRMSNKAEYEINGLERAGILSSRTNFIELRSGNVINKAFIIAIDLDKKETREMFLKSSVGKKLLIPDTI